MVRRARTALVRGRHPRGGTRRRLRPAGVRVVRASRCWGVAVGVVAGLASRDVGSPVRRRACPRRWHRLVRAGRPPDYDDRPLGTSAPSASLGLLVPLATRALPILMFFITFLFINTEVWRVGVGAQRGRVGGGVLCFGLARSDSWWRGWVRKLDQSSTRSRSTRAGRDGARRWRRRRAPRRPGASAWGCAPGGRAQMVNLVLVLVIAQAVQVLLLSVAVFLLLRRLRCGGDRREGHHRRLDRRRPVTTSLFDRRREHPADQGRDLPHGSFSSLYFTVYAVTDATSASSSSPRSCASSPGVVRRADRATASCGGRAGGEHRSAHRDRHRSSQASRSCSTRAAILSTAAWSSPS